MEKAITCFTKNLQLPEQLCTNQAVKSRKAKFGRQLTTRPIKVYLINSIGIWKKK